jgi:hypothetical protein
MSAMRIDRLTIQTEGHDAFEARRLARAVADRLGQGMVDGGVRPRRHAIVDVQVPPGLAGERLADHVAREILRQLA